jgi:hypothetical protein
MSGDTSRDFDRVCETVLGRPVQYRRLPQPVGTFVYEGRIEDRDLELWTEMGRWREDGQPHDFDLALTRAASPA